MKSTVLNFYLTFCIKIKQKYGRPHDRLIALEYF